MIVIALVSSKGGVSKSTLATNLATMAAGEGETALVIDLDPQETAAKWSLLRGGKPPEVVAGLPKALSAMLDAARSAGVDTVLIDTQGHASQPGVIAARAAELVLVPCRTSAADILAMGDTARLLENADALDKAVVVLFAPSANSREIAEAEAALDEFGLRCLGAHVSDLKDYRDAFKAGSGVIETAPGGAAASQIRQLWSAIHDHMKARGKRRKARV